MLLPLLQAWKAEICTGDICPVVTATPTPTVTPTVTPTPTVSETRPANLPARAYLPQVSR